MYSHVFFNVCLKLCNTCVDITFIESDDLSNEALNYSTVFKGSFDSPYYYIDYY